MNISKKSPLEKEYRRYFYIMLFISTLLRLIYASLIEISPDEAYYWNWSRHLDLSYYDHPPMVAYVIYLSTLFNKFNTELFVRLGAVLLSAGTSFVIFSMTREIFHEKAAFWAALWLNAIFIFSLGGIIITPDTPQGFFFILFIYHLYKALFSDAKNRYFYSAGVFLGLSFISKYTSFLIVPSAMLFLSLSKNRRSLLSDIRLYLMFIISALFFTPILIWNSRNNWISFSFQLSQGFGGGFENPLKNISELLGTQILLITPFIFMLTVLAFKYAWDRSMQHKDEKMLFLLTTSLPIIIFFFAVSLKSKVEGNWPVFAYLPIIPVLGFISADYKTIFDKKDIKRLTIIRNGGIVSSIFILILFYIIILYPPHLLLNNRGLTNRIFGWKEIGKEVSIIMSGVEKDTIFIFGDRHQTSSEISFYTDKRYDTYQRGGYGRYPYLKDVNGLTGKDALYIGEEERDEYKNIKKFFSDVELLKEVDIIIRGKKIRGFKIYRCYNYKGGLINV